MDRSFPAVAAVLLTAPMVSSCGLFSGGDRLDDALDLLPTDATSVIFVDRAAIAERLDIEDADPDEYSEAIGQDPIAGTDLAAYLEVMAEGAAFDERDVEWSARATLDGDIVHAYKLDDDVDLGALVDDLVDAGLSEEEGDGHVRLRGDPAEVVDTFDSVGEVYPGEFFDVAVDSDDDLVIVGSGVDSVLETMDGERDSLIDSDVFDGVLEEADDVVYAQLDTEPLCFTGQSTPGEADPLDVAEELGILGVGAPQTTAFLVSGDETDQSARLAFDDQDEAEADLEARRTYLEEGLLLQNRLPFAEQGTAELDRDGTVVRVELDLDEPRTGPSMARSGDGFLACVAAGSG